jgi:hypothetical protein
VGVDNIEMIPVQVGRNIDVDLKIRNSGPATATKVRITVVCAVRANEPIPAIPTEQTGPPAVLISDAFATIKCFENSPVLSQDSINALNEHRMTLWIVGRIDYVGPPNGTSYSTTFRFQHVPGGVRWAIVGDDNQAT